jgi:uncharacterized membrane protein
MITGSERKFNAQISILASYDDLIKITISDKDASLDIIELNLTREQFINATMNRLSNTEVSSSVAYGIENIGKKLEMDTLVFEIPKGLLRLESVDKTLQKLALKSTPEGWYPDMNFNSQNSFFGKDGKHYARTIIRRWV